MVGEVNEGWKTRGGGFGDLELAANALGVCEDAIDLATAQAKSRWPAPRYVLDNQTIQLQLSEMHMLTEALRSFLMRIAAETDARQHTTSGVFLMNFATDVIQRVTRLNMDVHGGAGATEMPARVEKLARDAVIWTHLAGDSVQRMKPVRRMKWS